MDQPADGQAAMAAFADRPDVAQINLLQYGVCKTLKFTCSPLFIKYGVEIKKPLSKLKGFDVVMDGIEPPTQGFSILCSTN